MRCALTKPYSGLSEIIEADILVADAERVEQVKDGLGHHCVPSSAPSARPARPSAPRAHYIPHSTT